MGALFRRDTRGYEDYICAVLKDGRNYESISAKSVEDYKPYCEIYGSMGCGLWSFYDEINKKHYNVEEFFGKGYRNVGNAVFEKGIINRHSIKIIFYEIFSIELQVYKNWDKVSTYRCFKQDKDDKTHEVVENPMDLLCDLGFLTYEYDKHYFCKDPSDSLEQYYFNKEITHSTYLTNVSLAELATSITFHDKYSFTKIVSESIYNPYIRIDIREINRDEDSGDEVNESEGSGQSYSEEYSYIDKDGNTVTKIWNISNNDFTNSSELSQKEVTDICQEKNSGLVTRGFDTAIYEFAKNKDINSKIVLATLAQEQGWCKNGKYEKAFGVGEGGNPIDFAEGSKGGVGLAIDTYLKLFNEGLAKENGGGLSALLVNHDPSPYKETKAVFGSGTAQWQANNPKYVSYMEKGQNIMPVNAAMYAKLRYTPWVDFPPQNSYPLDTWLSIYNSF